MNIRELNETIEKVLKEDSKGILALSDNLVNRLTFGYLGSENKLPHFKSLDELEEYIRVNNSFPDNFFYQDAMFTNDEYDMEGEYLSYGCPQLNKGIIVRTPNNRYSHKGNYAELEFDISEEDDWSFRFDLTYYLPKEVYLTLYDKNETFKESKNKKFKTIMVDDRYAIYPDGVIYDTEKAEDIPSYVFEIRDKIMQ